jgi:ATP-dependent helicase Lhr and Lhr-like helicase
VRVEFTTGRSLGSVEESFVAKMKSGDVFIFAGRMLELVRVRDMVAQVKVATKKRGAVPRWGGGKMPISSCLAQQVRYRLDQAARGHLPDEEMGCVAGILHTQARWSSIPRIGETLVERTRTRDGWHVYLFPFLGRLVHEGLSALLAYRLGQGGWKPITATFNDYGLELLSPTTLEPDEEHLRRLLSPDLLIEHIEAALNAGELSRRHFREIARIAGLLVPSRPGAMKTTRQMQASSGLFFDVFSEFDPENLLLRQARREVLERQLEFARMKSSLETLEASPLIVNHVQRLSPLAFPLWAERIASQTLKFESASDRIERLARQLELDATSD